MTGNLTITVTRSAGTDGAVLVFIDTDGEPNGSDGGPALRVLLNDDEAFVGVPYALDDHREAASVTFDVPLPTYTDEDDEDDMPQPAADPCAGRGGHGDPRCGRALGHEGSCDWTD